MIQKIHKERETDLFAAYTTPFLLHIFILTQKALFSYRFNKEKFVSFSIEKLEELVNICI